MYTQVMRSPLAPLKKGGTGVKVPLLKGDARGISEDFGSTQRCVYTVVQRGWLGEIGFDPSVLRY